MQFMKKYLTEQEQTRLLAHLKSLASPIARRDRAWISLVKNTGMRIGEFSLMTVRDAKFALEGGWIHIPKEHRKGWNRKPRKDGTLRKPPPPHDVPVTNAIDQDLNALLKLQRELGGSGMADEPLVMSRQGKPLSVRSYQARMEHWSRQCNLQATPHALRHTCAMNIMRRSTSEDPRGVVQAILGHADIRSSGIYTALNREEVRAAFEESHGPRRLRKRQVGKAYAQQVAA